MKFSLKNFLRRRKIKKLEKEIEKTTKECAPYFDEIERAIFWRMNGYGINSILRGDGRYNPTINRTKLIKQLAELEGVTEWQ